MKLLVFLFVILFVSKTIGAKGDDEEYEDDFSEFDEEFENDGQEEISMEIKETKDSSSSLNNDEDDDEAIVEMENEFSHFEDEEEFEGYRNDDDLDDNEEFENKKKTPSSPPKTITITEVPAHLRSSWDTYYLELLMAFGLLIYILNFLTGRLKNQKIANVWFSSHRSLLESNFALVGDDGVSKNIDDIETKVRKEAEHIFTIWCSGRTCCEGMLITLHLLKRQDLFSLIGNSVKSSIFDQIRIKVSMNKEDMDTFVFAIATKKTAIKMSKELGDINTFCPERRSTEKYDVPSHFQIMSEIHETSSAMMDAKMIQFLNKYSSFIDSIHFSDLYSGNKVNTDDVSSNTLLSLERKPTLLFNFNLPLKGSSLESSIDAMTPCLHFVFYAMDKIKKYRLSKEAKTKAEKNRSKVSEAHWKSIHAAKAEKAQEERERKRREIKEKIREIEDPEKQRKLEERENRRDRKKAAPKIKQLKVKAM